MLDTNDEQLKERVRDWSMKKMATQFQSYKKNIYNDYIKKNKTPDFNCKHFVKLRPFWDEFVQFKMSATGEKELRKCPTQDLPPYDGIRWLPYFHS
jgi:murein endopeptidase